MHLVQPFPNGALVAAVDGLGHGAEAAVAAQTAIATLREHAGEPILKLLERCHEALHETRGVVLTLASFNAVDGTMSWLGVGSVEGLLLKAGVPGGRADVMLYGGVVGLHLPAPRASAVPVAPGDTLVLATDGIRGCFADKLRLEEAPRQMAEGILARDAKGTDDALVVVARYRGGTP
jgi:hypothetical protein